MKKVITLFAVLLFAVSQGTFAQRTITGKVISEENGLGMPGVYVVVKGTTIGAATDIDGNFTLNVPNDATLQMSYIGYKTIEMVVENQTRFDIMLQIDTNVLGDVVVSAARAIPPERAVVTSMGIVRDKISLTYSTQSILGGELVVIPPSSSDPGNYMIGLNGKIAGVNVMNGGYVQIRGQKSFNYPSLSLYVVDGVPMGNDIPQINPEDIENVTVLKSANAAILYGSQGANGAVLITMKKAKTISQDASTQKSTSQNVSAQRTIIGKVINDKNGRGMSGIPILVKGTTIGTKTDRDGNFVLKAPQDAIIVVSFRGFKTVEMQIENKSWYEITLQPEV